MNTKKETDVILEATKLVVPERTCRTCKYYLKKISLCISEPPTIIYHDVLKVRDKSGKILETRAPNIVNVNPFVEPNRRACRFYNEE